MELKTKYGTFVLVNDDKVQRVLEGTTNAKGEFLAGLGEEAVEKNAEAVLVAYDKLAGLIRGEEGATVKAGCFWDVKKKAPVEKPVVIYTYRINGEVVEMEAGEKKPLLVQAAEMQEAAKKTARKKTK